MGVTQFPNRQRFAILDTDSTTWLGGFQSDRHIELKWIRLRLYKEGTLAGSERLRLNIYSRSDLDGLVAQSDWVDVGDVAEVVPSKWYGLVRFDYAREFINLATTYHLGIETENYTLNGHTLYIGIGLEMVEYSMSVNTVASGAPAEAHIFGYMELRR